MACGIYCIERIETGQKYIGKGKNVKKEMKRSHKGCTYIYRALKKYGEGAFIQYVVEYCEPEEMEFWEQYYIREWNTKAPNGYNLTDGGKGTLNLAEEIRRIISKALTGKPKSESAKKSMSKNHADFKKENHPMWGKHHSPKTIELMNKNRPDFSGKNNPMYGKIQSEESKEKNRQSQLGKTCSNETKEKISMANQGQKRSDETKEKISKSKIGKKRSGSSSQYFGVSIHRDSGCWQVNIGRRYVGLYKTEIEAALIYDKYIIENNINRPLNFPEK